MEIYNEEQNKNSASYSEKKISKANLSSGLAIGKIYLWFAVGLLLTGAVAMGLPFLMTSIYGGATDEAFNAYMVVLVISLIMYIPCCIAINIASFAKHAAAIGIFYVLFALSFGGLLSCVTLVLPVDTMFYAFFITAGSFALMGFLGYITKGKIGMPILFLCAFVFGLTIIALFNLLLFNGSSYIMYYWIISIATLVIFLLIAAVDTNRVIRNAQNNPNLASNNTMIIYSAYVLYSDFMIIFYYVLRLLAMFSNNKN